ncbi:MAG: hypothetical protein IJ092_07040 [Atopobiaceae bacterium]|nr:hypothetical protein [Atopobiaceae bacterium]
MADISKITLPTGTTYDIKDATARSLIDQMSGYTDFLGVTTTALTDGATTNPITVAGESVTAKKGNIATYGSSEFIFNGTAWQAFGDLSGLGALAYKDSASGSGSVAVPKTYTTTVTPVAKNVSVTGTTTGSVTETKSTVTVSKASSGTATYTPAGTNGTSSVTGSCSVTPSGTIGTGSGTANYTPAGSVSTPTITVTPNTATVNSITAVGTLPSCTLPAFTATVASETLTLGWAAGSFSAGSLPTKGSNQTVVTGIKSATSTQPSFTGTGAELTFTGESSTGTISGTAAAQKFTGTGARLVTDSQVLTGAAFAGASMTTTGSYTPAAPTATTTTASTETKTVSVTVS